MTADPKELFSAIDRRDLESVRRVLDAGVDASSRDGSAIGHTALIRASAEGMADVVALLLEKGARVDDANGAGFTPLMSASSDGHVDVARLLLAAGARLDAVNGEGDTARSRAAALKQHDFVELIDEAQRIRITRARSAARQARLRTWRPG